MSYDPEPIPFPSGGPTLAEYIARGIASLPIQLEQPAPDPVIVAQRSRYRMNRQQRRAADRLVTEPQP